MIKNSGEKEKKEKKEKRSDDGPNEKFAREKNLDVPHVKLEEIIRKCKEYIVQIDEILNSSHEENNEEFVDTTKAVENILDQILKNQGVSMEKVDILQLEVYLRDFLSHLQKMQNSGRLLKFLTSNRLRKKLEESNMNIMYIMKRIEQTSSRKQKMLKPVPSQIFFYDEQGRAMWETIFGLENSLVEWNRFIKGLAKYLNIQLSLRDEMNLKRILDTTHVGVVSPFKFSQFLRGFGPLKACIEKANKLLSEKWFHGFLSRREAALLLANQPVGTFMVRFSKSQPGSFALAFVGEEKQVVSVMIESEMPRGVKIKELGGTDRRFKDLTELLANYKDHLVAPFDSDLPEQPWFQGDLIQEEAELLLFGRPAGTYLIRMGEGTDKVAFVLTYIDATGKILHTPIHRTDKGFLPEGTAKPFSNLNQWIAESRSFLKYNYDRDGVSLFRLPELLQEQKSVVYGPEDAEAMKPDDWRTPKDPVNCGYACTTYPDQHGLWSLICDMYTYRTFPNWKIVALADGCNWGPRPKTAAWKAAQTFTDFVVAQSKAFVDTKCVGYLLLKAFAAAHEKVIEGFSKEDIWDAGTTTLIGGVLVPVEVPGGRPDEKFGFVCASVGDCKAFLYSPKEKKAVDITLGNRAGLDATDPGGRLGPFVGRSGDPDLRNLHLYFTLCCEGDIIIVMSDGVHDNLDAYSLGKTPEAIGFPNTDWKDLPPLQLGIAKSNFMCKKLVEVIGDVVPDATRIASKLIDYSLDITEVSRVFMRDNPRQKLPIDYVKYPGKMDHASVICMTVKS